MEVLVVKYGSPIPNGCDPSRDVLAFGWGGEATIIRCGPHDDIDDAIRQVPHIRKMRVAATRKKLARDN